MSLSPLKKCTHPGCRQLVRSPASRCEKHAASKGTTKNKPGDPFYSSAAWLRLRDYKRQQNPLCEQCEKSGKAVAMHAVDHVKPRRDYPELEFDCDNLMSLCERCHNTKTRREVAARAASVPK
jgi:5-methylcytosine-specific restriction endonuclease McrA